MITVVKSVAPSLFDATHVFDTLSRFGVKMTSTTESNELTGTIPSEIGMLTQLTILGLGKLVCGERILGRILLLLLAISSSESNTLTGTIPLEVLNLNIPDFDYSKYNGSWDRGSKEFFDSILSFVLLSVWCCRWK